MLTGSARAAWRPPPVDLRVGSDGATTPTPPARHDAIPPPTVSGTNGDSRQEASCRVLGALLYPSVPLWTFVSGAVTALSRALSLGFVPLVIIRDLPAPVHDRTPSPPPGTRLVLSDHDSDDNPVECHQPQSAIPSLSELMEEEDHELSIRRRRVRRKRAADSASKLRRSSRLAAKEDPYYTDATSKATRIKASKLDISKASERMKNALQSSGMLLRPPPAQVPSPQLRCLGSICGLPHLSEVEDEGPPAS